jgi:hypothetical protein
MAIIDATTWQGLTSNSVSGGDLAAVSALSDAVSDVITRMCYPNVLEPTTFTLAAFDAPLGNVLLLPRPIRSISAIYLVPNANGDPSGCNSTTLLADYSDYMLDISDKVANISRTGRVYRRGASWWGFEWRWPIGRLAPAIDPNRGALFVSGEFGPSSVSPAVQLAASSAVTLLYERRKSGAPLNSENWGGYGYSAAGQFTAEAAVSSPEVMGLLRMAGVLNYAIGGS